MLAAGDSDDVAVLNVISELRRPADALALSSISAMLMVLLVFFRGKFLCRSGEVGCCNERDYLVPCCLSRYEVAHHLTTT